MHKKILIFILMPLFLILSSCGRQPEVISEKTFALDTLIEIKIYQYSDQKNRENLIQESFALIRSLENTLSMHVDGSDIMRLNEDAGKNTTKVSKMAYDVLQDSVYFSSLTDGLFDVTAGPLIDLWAIDPPYGHVPTQDELDNVLPLIDYQKMIFSDNNHVRLQDEGMVVNLGAIAKGTIADEVKDYLVSHGVNHAMINLGGNILLVGPKLDGSSFIIGIQDPSSLRGEYLMSIFVDDVAVVSSGDYERYFEYEGKKYHHILNPKTGFPADTNIKQVTIVTPDSQTADGLSTSVLLLGLKRGIALVESLEAVEAVFITKDNEIYITDGLRDKYETSGSLIDDYTIIDDPARLLH
jgi:thiamine biosynthesis lipoprotein